MTDDCDPRAALLACPFCGEVPEIHKHVRYDIWRLTHRCSVLGPILLDWTDEIERLVKRWNTRHG
jgi:hypothetical protein